MSVLNSKSVQPFLEYLKYEKRYSVHTFTSYQNDLADFISFLDTGYGGVALKDINHQFVRSWLAGLKDRGLSSKTISRKISSLRSFFKYC
jgi:integrase/recombinase XerC